MHYCGILLCNTSTKDHEVFYKLCKLKVFLCVYVCLFVFLANNLTIFLFNIESFLVLCVSVGKVGLCLKKEPDLS